MIGSLLTLLAVLVAVAILFHVPALYPAAVTLEHAFVGFARAIVNGLSR